MKRKVDNITLWILGVGIALMAVFFYLWFSPLLLAICSIILIADIAVIVSQLMSKNDDAPGCICAIGIFLIFALVVSDFFMRGTYYVSEFGGCRHLYQDCNGLCSRGHKVGKVGTMLLWCFDDCDLCHERSVMEQKRTEMIKRESDISHIEDQIAELEKVKDRLRKGDAIDIGDYAFRYQVEEEIAEAAIEDYREFGHYSARSR